MHAEATTFKYYARRLEHKQANWFLNRAFVLEILGVYIKGSPTSGSLPLPHTVLH